MKKIPGIGLPITTAALLGTALPVAAQATDQTLTEQQKDPNIIYILVDDMGYGDLGCYGQKDIRTPNLDKMADEGLLFTNHYAGAPVSAPSRCSLLTGKHTGKAAIRGNKELLPDGQYPLPKEEVTIAEMLKQDGYKTALIGKWGLGMNKTEGDPSAQGFDEYYGYLCQRNAHNYYPYYIYENGTKVKLKWQKYTHDLFTEKALNYVKENKDDKFFLYLAYTIPHSRLQVPSNDPYSRKNWLFSKKKFAAMITRMDRDIGTLLDYLKKSGLADNTIVMFSSDNGPHAEGGANPSYFNSSGGLRGMKRDLYEGGIKVPMIAWWPGKITPGTTDHISAFEDVMPTIADLTETETPKEITGISFYNTLLGKENKQHEFLFWEFHGGNGKQAVRMGKWKAVRLNITGIHKETYKLFNLEEDPFEKKDISEKYPEIMNKMKLIMEQEHTPNKIFDSF